MKFCPQTHVEIESKVGGANMFHLLSLYMAHVTLAYIGTAIAVLVGLAFRVILFAQPGKRNPLWRQLFFKKSQETHQPR